MQKEIELALAIHLQTEIRVDHLNRIDFESAEFIKQEIILKNLTNWINRETKNWEKEEDEEEED